MRNITKWKTLLERIKTMQYLQSKQGGSRVIDYRGTTINLNDKDLKEIKATVQEHNKVARKWLRLHPTSTATILRVRIMPRGPRVEAAAKDGWKYKAVYYSYLPQRHATHFDIYVGEDTNAMHIMRREIKTGMTASQQRKHDDLMYQARRIEWQGRDNILIKEYDKQHG